MRKQVITHRSDDLRAPLTCYEADGTMMSRRDSEVDHLKPNEVHEQVSINDGLT